LPFTILDKNDGPGGTWWENRYPGARVDVGSHQYCYSFEPADHWSQYYCEQPELRAYFDGVVEKYGLRQHCRFGTTVTSIVWDEAAAQWHVTVQRPDGTTETIDAPFVISAVGSLNLPHVPEIPGMETFSRSVVPLGALARRSRHHRHPLRAHRRRSERFPDRADDRGRGRAADDLPAHRTMDQLQPRVPRQGACRAITGRCAICRSTRGGSDS
jgi:cation diffusion facilitator CzcD-associated flavoprotein CzcO